MSGCMSLTNHMQNRGFVALLSVLIIAGLLLAYTTTSASALFFGQHALVEEYAYRSAVDAAWSCAVFAFERLDIDPNRFIDSPATNIPLREATCSILAASSSDDRAGALVLGHAGDSFVELYVEASRANGCCAVQASEMDGILRKFPLRIIRCMRSQPQKKSLSKQVSRKIRIYP